MSDQVKCKVCNKSFKTTALCDRHRVSHSHIQNMVGTYSVEEKDQVRLRNDILRIESLKNDLRKVDADIAKMVVKIDALCEVGNELICEGIPRGEHRCSLEIDFALGKQKKIDKLKTNANRRLDNLSNERKLSAEQLKALEDEIRSYTLSAPGIVMPKVKTAHLKKVNDEVSSHSSSSGDEYEVIVSIGEFDCDSEPDLLTPADEDEFLVEVFNQMKNNKFLYQDYRKLSLCDIFTILMWGEHVHGYDVVKDKQWVQARIKQDVDEMLKPLPSFLKRDILRKYKRRELFMAQCSHDELGIKFNLMKYLRVRDERAYSDHDNNVSWHHFLANSHFDYETETGDTLHSYLNTY